ncbi:peroxidase-related enzyme [Vibrio alginolyticus]|uniref:carboxymuconolactone decarboxylase family protein n=1 Tax=uncultured Vibrio sp. TaxID=114054 RepID=UPI00280D6CD0|nr:peroxidase-related enzyme [uncultured Vibrio sp.]ELB2812689.1 peroxidase-related enzyme [Vibrio alginolyticus]
MSRIPTPASIDLAPEASKGSLQAVNSLLGVVPNMFRLISNSPQTLEGYLGLNGALGKGSLDAPTRERIALAVAEINGCGYCLAAHNYLGSNLAKLSAEEIEANRRGLSGDSKAAVAVEFAVKITKNRGQVSNVDVQVVRDAGYSDAEILEIVGHVALNTLTNYVNEVLGTEIDFPTVEAL